MRKIDIYYCFDDKEVNITIKEEKLMHYQCRSISYNYKDYLDWIELYNTTLDDFDAEYDEEIADGLETLCNQFWKEKDNLCDSAIQE